MSYHLPAQRKKHDRAGTVHWVRNFCFQLQHCTRSTEKSVFYDKKKTQWTFNYDYFPAKEHSCAKISEFCNDKSIFCTKKMCFFIKPVSIFCSPSILEQHQWFEPACHTKSSWSRRCECPLNCLHSSIPVGLLVGEGWQKNETGSCFKLVLDVASKFFLICLPQKYSSHYSTVQKQSVSSSTCMQTSKYHVDGTKPRVTTKKQVQLNIINSISPSCKMQEHLEYQCRWKMPCNQPHFSFFSSQLFEDKRRKKSLQWPVGSFDSPVSGQCGMIQAFLVIQWEHYLFKSFL